MRKFVRRPSPAMIIACLALFVSLTGTSIAASKYLITSTKQIKPSVLKQLKGAKGPQGPAGAPGATGATGPAGANGATHVTIRTAFDTGAYINYSWVRANCNPGEVATGGGGGGLTTGDALPYVVYSVSYPYTAGSTPTGWEVDVANLSYYANDSSAGAVQAEAFVICASP